MFRSGGSRASHRHREPPRGPPPVFAMPNFDLPPALFLPAAALYDLAHAPELLQPGLSMLGL